MQILHNRSLVKRAFTLIELLIVIAIIAILAAILFPVFGRARENARRSSCQSNLKQLGLGMLQYCQDYDEKFPSFSQSEFKGWGNNVQPYLKSVQILQCPSEPNGPDSNFGRAGYSDYTYNLALGFNYTSFIGEGIALASLTTSAQTIMLCEDVTTNAEGWSAGAGGDITGTGLATFRTAPTVQSPALTIESSVAKRHLDGQNFLLTDGHVKWYKSATTNQSAVVHAVGDCSASALNGAPSFCYDIK